MATPVVMKFGGTSVGSAERIGNVAKRVVAHRKRTGEQVVVVVSAMSGDTDRLIELARKVSGTKVLNREYHQLLAAGEQVTSALTAMAFEREGAKSQSLVAYQVPIRTKSAFGLELISEIETENLQRMMDDGIIPVVAGFQGVDDNEGYTTLGRGGSDTTAVAIAAALGSCKCYIFTDVDGVYTALPSVCKQAKKLKHLTYEEMLELASSGAKVLQTRSVSLGRKFRVPIIVCSSFSDAEGTEIVEEYSGMEDAVVSGITCKGDQARITIRQLPDKAGVAGKIFDSIAAAGIVVDMIIQTQSAGGKATISFTVPSESGTAAYDLLMKLLQKEALEANIEIDKSMAKLSVVGEGMRTHSGVAADVFRILGKEGINVEMITTSEIAISVALHQKYSELAVRVLHEHFIENAERISK